MSRVVVPAVALADAMGGFGWPARIGRVGVGMTAQVRSTVMEAAMVEFVRRWPPAIRIGLLVGAILVVQTLLFGRGLGVALFASLGWAMAAGGAVWFGDLARSPGAWVPWRWALPASLVMAGSTLGVWFASGHVVFGLLMAGAAVVTLVGLGPAMPKWRR